MADTDTTISKTRIDAWDATLTEAQRWQVYDKLRTAPWYQVADWAAKEFGLAAEPSRAAMYRFAARMRSQESAHRIESALLARDEAGALVAAKSNDAETIAAYMALAQDLALSGDATTAVKYTKMALSISAQETKRRELDIKKRDQELREREVAVKEATSREIAVDVLLKQAGKNERAKELLRQFVEALG